MIYSNQESDWLGTSYRITECKACDYHLHTLPEKARTIN